MRCIDILDPTLELPSFAALPATSSRVLLVSIVVTRLDKDDSLNFGMGNTPKPPGINTHLPRGRAAGRTSRHVSTIHDGWSWRNFLKI